MFNLNVALGPFNGGCHLDDVEWSVRYSSPKLIAAALPSSHQRHNLNVDMVGEVDGYDIIAYDI